MSDPAVAAASPQLVVSSHLCIKCNDVVHVHVVLFRVVPFCSCSCPCVFVFDFAALRFSGTLLQSRYYFRLSIVELAVDAALAFCGTLLQSFAWDAQRCY